ncbi:MAG TPA: sigma-70 family RNA polymerase sigma factor [Blastocatellia bacterium]|jgi:RNA polymerase sigma factor (sigma-70 family)|nr:sigma-70 family RNA polymerase sigma factor [Blastocatellia bacterium]
MTERSDADTTVEPTPADDLTLVERCLAGDAAAWEALIVRYQRLIYSIPLRSGFSPVDTADIFQSVCVILLKKLPTLRDRARISSWLITTTTRECWRLAQKRRRETQPSVYGEEYDRDILNNLESSAPLAEQQRISFESQQAVRDAVAALNERCRLLITLLFYSKEELSYAEIARRTGIPQNSLGPNRARCLQRLKRALEGRV